MSLNKLILSALFLMPTCTFATINVVTTTSDLASLAKEVGGDWVDVKSIAKGYQDPHFVEAKPSYLLYLRRADLFIQVGLELEVAWAPSLLTNSRNPKILPGNPGFLDVSEGCEILQQSSGGVDRSQGDVHPFGNPHYWLDPENGRRMARSIADKLKSIDSSHSQDYTANLEKFETRLRQKEKEWDGLAAKLKGLRVVTYHNSWPNFAKRFNLEIVNYVEPRAGIPPSPAHLDELIRQIKTERIPFLMMEPYFDVKLPEKIARETGSKLIILAPSVGGEKGIDSYFDLFDHDLNLITNAGGGR